MFGFGHWEILLIGLIVLIIFGAGKLPEIGSGIGKGIKNFKEATRNEDKKSIDENKDNSDSSKS